MGEGPLLDAGTQGYLILYMGEGDLGQEILPRRVRTARVFRRGPRKKKESTMVETWSHYSAQNCAQQDSSVAGV